MSLFNDVGQAFFILTLSMAFGEFDVLGVDNLGVRVGGGYLLADGLRAVAQEP